MDCAMVIASEALEQFRKSTLRTVAAVHERRDNSETQVRASEVDTN